MTDTRNWQSVLVFGRFEELKTREAQKASGILFGHVFHLLTAVLFIQMAMKYQ